MIHSFFPQSVCYGKKVRVNIENTTALNFCTRTCMHIFTQYNIHTQYIVVHPLTLNTYLVAHQPNKAVHPLTIHSHLVVHKFTNHKIYGGPLIQPSHNIW